VWIALSGVLGAMSPTKKIKFNMCWVYFGCIANFIKSFISIYSIKTIKS